MIDAIQESTPLLMEFTGIQEASAPDSGFADALLALYKPQPKLGESIAVDDTMPLDVVDQVDDWQSEDIGRRFVLPASFPNPVSFVDNPVSPTEMTQAASTSIGYVSTQRAEQNISAHTAPIDPEALLGVNQLEVLPVGSGDVAITQAIHPAQADSKNESTQQVLQQTQASILSLEPKEYSDAHAVVTPEPLNEVEDQQPVVTHLQAGARSAREPAQAVVQQINADNATAQRLEQPMVSIDSEPPVSGSVSQAHANATGFAENMADRVGAAESTASHESSGNSLGRHSDMQLDQQPSDPIVTASTATIAQTRETAGRIGQNAASSETHVRIIDQVVQQVRLQQSDGAADLTIRLNPPDLGQLQLRVTRDASGVFTHIEASNNRVQGLLEAHMPLLMDSLTQAGVRMDSVSVSTSTAFGAFGQDARQNKAQPRSQRQRPNDSADRGSDRIFAPATMQGQWVQAKLSAHSWLA